MDGLVQALREHDISAMELGEQTTLQIDKGFRGEWFRVDDHVGFVNRKPLRIIEQ